MPVTPDGPISLSIAALRSMVSKSATFQTWVGAANETLALARVFTVAALPYDDAGEYDIATIVALRPYVLINLHSRQGFRYSRDSNDSFIDHGQLTIHFEANISAGTNASNYQDVITTFTNNVGKTLSEIVAQANAGGSLLIQEIQSITPFARADPKLIKSMGDFHFAAFSANYGLQQH